MKIDALKKEIDEGRGLLVDVRELEEWNQGHLLHAIHLPLSQITALNIPQLPLDKHLYLYCRSGGRSFRAADLLKSHYSNITPLKWGYLDLNKEKF